MAQILFFGTHSDLAPVLTDLEGAGELQYTATDFTSASPPSTWSAGASLPGLGIADASSAASCATYLVTPAGAKVNVRRVTTEDNGVANLVDQFENDASVLFTPAGKFDAQTMLYGKVSTVWDDPVSKSLMRRFSSTFKRHFTKVKAYWVGPEALQLLRSGARLTIGAQSAPNFDLVER